MASSDHDLYGGIIPDSEDEDMFMEPLNVGSSTVAVSSIRTAEILSKQPNDSIDTSSFMGDLPLSLPPIAVLPQSPDTSPAREPTTHNAHVNASTTAHIPAARHATSSSVISAYTPAVINPISTIQTSTTCPAVPGTSKPRPKPRPRPAYKNAKTAGSVTATSSITDFPTAVNADVPQFAAPDPITHSSSIPGLNIGKESDYGTGYAPVLAERAKLRARAKLDQQKGKQPMEDIEDIIDLCSFSEDELSLLPPRPKTKQNKSNAPPKLSRKKAKLTHDLEPINSTPITIPVPTSDILIPPSSPLPPSDPPLPSTATASTHVGRPLPKALITSSPSSPLPAPPRKRKRPSASASSHNEDGKTALSTHIATNFDDPPNPPDPPLFFAGSSSLPADQAEAAPVPSSSKGSKSKNSPGKRKDRRQDDEDWEADPKPKSKARKQTHEEDEWGADPKPKAKAKAKGKKQMDEEDEWEGERSVKPQPKAKPKPKRKGKPTNQAEVVIDLPKSRKRAKRTPTDIEEDTFAEAGVRPDLAEGPRVPGKATPTAVGLSTDSSELSSLESELELGIGQNKAGNKKTTANPAKVAIKSAKASESHVSVPKDDEPGPLSKPVPSAKSKPKKRLPVPSDTEDDDTGIGIQPSPKTPRLTKGKEKELAQPVRSPTPVLGNSETPVGRTSSFKENSVQQTPINRGDSRQPSSSALPSSLSKSSRSYSINPHKKTPMSELIRRVNSLPGSPFSARPISSPLTKASKSLLRNIAPLHPNRRTPPPPPPRPPPPKKSKKQLDLEEKWEMELEDTVDGWYCLPEEERAALRRAKRDKEMGFDD